MRSATAHEIFKDDQRIIVDSAGTAPEANKLISSQNLEWADSIIVMEKHHRNIIRKNFPAIYKNKRIICLYIPDDYDFMQEELISILKMKFEDIYDRGLI